MSETSEPTNDQQLVVILTAAVVPSVERVAVQNPEVRFHQYCSAIVHWIQVSSAYPIAFHLVETSGQGDRFRETLGHVISVEDHHPRPKDHARGKGHVEARALEQAIDSLSTRFGARASVFKCTGRLRITNAARLMRPLGPREVLGRATLDFTVIDTRFLGARISLWVDLLPEIATLTDENSGVNLEHAFALALLRRAQHGRLVFSRFSTKPKYEGQSGSTGEWYSDTLTLSRLSASALEYLLRRVPRSKQF